MSFILFVSEAVFYDFVNVVSFIEEFLYCTMTILSHFFVDTGRLYHEVNNNSVGTTSPPGLQELHKMSTIAYTVSITEHYYPTWYMMFSIILHSWHYFPHLVYENITIKQ